MLGGQGDRGVSRFRSQWAGFKSQPLTYRPVTLDELPSPRKCPDLRNIRNPEGAWQTPGVHSGGDHHGDDMKRGTMVGSPVLPLACLTNRPEPALWSQRAVQPGGGHTSLPSTP